MKLYHGTSESHLATILENGIEPRAESDTSNWEHTVESNPDCVYLTNSGYALLYASQAANDDDRLCIFEVEVELDDLLPDEDFIEQSTRNNPIEGADAPELLGGMNTRTEWIRDNIIGFQHYAERSLEGMGTCSHNGVIPLEGITRYVLLDGNGVMMICDPAVGPMNYMIMGGQYRNLIRAVFDDWDDWEEDWQDEITGPMGPTGEPWPTHRERCIEWLKYNNPERISLQD